MACSLVVTFLILNHFCLGSRSQWAPPFHMDCDIALGQEHGVTDNGTVDHACESCGLACNQGNKQKSVYTKFDFEPSLNERNLYDVETKIEWTNFARLREYGSNGIYQAMRFMMALKPGAVKQFGGYMGPQIKGQGENAPLGGMHLFSMWDTHKPNVDGSSPSGRRLVIPAADPGQCMRNCQDCGLHPELAAAALTTGTQCKLDGFTVDDGSAFVYRIHMSNSHASSMYDGQLYSGTEWEVVVTDLSTHEVFVLGRVLLEGDTQSQGINLWTNFHEHLGCTPCDAFYESTTVTGPFIREPQGAHKISRVYVEPPKSEYTCRLFRTVGLSNFAVLIETGPGVAPATEADAQQATLLSACEKANAPPTPALPSPAPPTPALPTPAPTRASTPAPTKKKKKAKCKRSCRRSPKPWTKKCNKRKCSGCNQCKVSRRMQAAVEAPAFMTDHVLV